MARETVDGKNATSDITIHYVNIQPTPGAPVVHFIKRPGEFALPIVLVLRMMIVLSMM